MKISICINEKDEPNGFSLHLRHETEKIDIECFEYLNLFYEAIFDKLSEISKGQNFISKKIPYER